MVSIVGILSAIAVPSFSSSIARQRAKAVASELFATLSVARNEAIKRNADVTLKPKTGGWSNGWQVVDASSTVLDDRSSTAGVTITTLATSVIYRPAGRIRTGTVPMFQISTTYGSATEYQCVSVELSGRPYTTAAASC